MLIPSLFGEDFFDDLFEVPSWPTRRYVNAVFPQLNIYENDASYFITAEIPGIDKNDLKINVKGKTLTIEGKRTKPATEKTDYYRSERVQGEFKRSVALTDQVDTAKIDAQLKNGVLLLSLAKSEEHKPKEIQIK